MKDIEVELKFLLQNREELVSKLNAMAKAEKANDLQRDTYYAPPHKNFLDQKPISEWLRLRQSSKGSSINYKRWHNADGAKTVSCDELESNVDNVEALARLLSALGFKELVVVEKSRSAWIFRGTKIAIDEVKDLGDFIELEAYGDFAGIEGAKRHLYEVLGQLDARVGEQDFEGYPYGLLRKKGLVQ